MASGPISPAEDQFRSCAAIQIRSALYLLNSIWDANTALGWINEPA